MLSGPLLRRQVLSERGVFSTVRTAPVRTEWTLNFAYFPKQTSPYHICSPLRSPDGRIVSLLLKYVRSH